MYAMPVWPTSLPARTLPLPITPFPTHTLCPPIPYLLSLFPIPIMARFPTSHNRIATLVKEGGPEVQPPPHAQTHRPTQPPHNCAPPIANSPSPPQPQPTTAPAPAENIPCRRVTVPCSVPCLPLLPCMAPDPSREPIDRCNWPSLVSSDSAGSTVQRHSLLTAQLPLY